MAEAREVDGVRGSARILRCRRLEPQCRRVSQLPHRAGRAPGAHLASYAAYAHRRRRRAGWVAGDTAAGRQEDFVVGSCSLGISAVHQGDATLAHRTTDVTGRWVWRRTCWLTPSRGRTHWCWTYTGCSTSARNSTPGCQIMEEPSSAASHPLSSPPSTSTTALPPSSAGSTQSDSRARPGTPRRSAPCQEGRATAESAMNTRSQRTLTSPGLLSPPWPSRPLARPTAPMRRRSGRHANRSASPCWKRANRVASTGRPGGLRGELLTP